MIYKGLNIIFEDNHLLVVVKPPNMLSQSDITQDPDILTLLKEYIKEEYDKPGNVYLGLVHRLDRPVGGIMVFAKTSKAASRLSEQIRDRSFSKTYVAVVRGEVKTDKGRLTNYLVKQETTNKVREAKNEKDGQKATLDFEVLKKTKNLTILRIFLHTGRSHQIRVQLALAGHTIYGDQKYGSKLNEPGQQLALWSTAVAFKHPVKDEYLRFESRPPGEFPWNI